MIQDAIQNKMQELIKQIEKHNTLYYQKAQPQISDSQYDALFDELLDLEQQYPQFILPHSPTQKVGNDKDNRFPEVTHQIPMLSLDKVYHFQEILSWINKNIQKTQQDLSFTLEPKIDGFSVVLYYQKGKLIQAVSRGDGQVGNDLTPNILTIPDIPKTLSLPLDFSVRGEVYMAKKDFETYNNQMGNIYANPRNFAAGTIRRIDSQEVAKVPLKIFFYDGFCKENTFFSAFETINFLKENQFSLIPNLVFFGNQKDFMPLENLSSYLKDLEDKRQNLEYEIDGLVLKINEFDARESLGYTSRHPRWALAYKFESPKHATRVLSIEVQVGRTGKITPLALLEPVFILGSTVSKATLHNQDYISSLNLGVGDEVLISKRGEIIPAVEEVVKKHSQGSFVIPPLCPSCQTPLIAKGAHQFCPSSQCPAQILEGLIYFVQILDIEGLGKETVTTLYEKKLVTTPAHFYTLTQESFVGIEGFAQKKISLVLEGIKKSIQTPFSKLLVALGLPDIGPKVIEILINHGFYSLSLLVQTACKKEETLFTSIFGLGQGAAQAIIEHFNNPFVLEQLEALKRVGFVLEEIPLKTTTKGPFAQSFWVITGVFEHFKPREKATQIIEELGGVVESQVTKKTTHLLAGQKAGSKLKKAIENNANIVAEEEFLKMVQKESLKNQSLSQEKEDSLF